MLTDTQILDNFALFAVDSAMVIAHPCEWGDQPQDVEQICQDVRCVFGDHKFTSEQIKAAVERAINITWER